MQQEWGNCCLSFAEHVVNQLFLDIPIVMCFKELLIGTEGTVYRAAGVGRWAGGEADIKEMVYGEVTIFWKLWPTSQVTLFPLFSVLVEASYV